MSSDALVETTIAKPADAEDVASQLKKKTRIGERLIEASLFAAGAISILTTVGIVYVLVRDAIEFFLEPEVTLVEFLTSTTWQPMIGEFGIWPLLNATLIISFIGLLLAVPVGFFTAVYLSEYASPRVRTIMKPVLEIIAGIPTVVLGYFALTFVTPFLRSIFGDDVVKIYNMASAGLVVGILIIPLIASLCEDALHAVPDSLRQASYGLGATRMETSLKVVSPAALSGISAALVVATSRAVGETMIVALAAGAGPNFTFNPFESAETMTGYMVRISGGDLSYGSIDYQSIFAVGLVVFLLTLLLNIISQRIVRRFREVYE
jgi:phosphate transport system permease protein